MKEHEITLNKTQIVTGMDNIWWKLKLVNTHLILKDNFLPKLRYVGVAKIFLLSFPSISNMLFWHKSLKGTQ